MAYDKMLPARAILFKLSRPDEGCIYQQWYSNTGIVRPRFGLDEHGNLRLPGVDWPVLFDQLILEVQNATWQLDLRHDFASHEVRCDGSV